MMMFIEEMGVSNFFSVTLECNNRETQEYHHRSKRHSL